tara:strand:- start:15 stop:1034 length:1020 start_codon:yes stop_codon:yes gene_type:complete
MSEFIKKRREGLGYSQKTLAEKSGCSFASIQRAENEKSNSISSEMISSISSALKVDPRQLIAYIEQDNIKPAISLKEIKKFKKLADMKTWEWYGQDYIHEIPYLKIDYNLNKENITKSSQLLKSFFDLMESLFGVEFIETLGAPIFKQFSYNDVIQRLILEEKFYNLMESLSDRGISIYGTRNYFLSIESFDAEYNHAPGEYVIKNFEFLSTIRHSFIYISDLPLQSENQFDFYDNLPKNVNGNTSPYKIMNCKNENFINPGQGNGFVSLSFTDKEQSSNYIRRYNLSEKFASKTNDYIKAFNESIINGETITRDGIEMNQIDKIKKYVKSENIIKEEK